MAFANNKNLPETICHYYQLATVGDKPSGCSGVRDFGISGFRVLTTKVPWLSRRGYRGVPQTFFFILIMGVQNWVVAGFFVSAVFFFCASRVLFLFSVRTLRRTGVSGTGAPVLISCLFTFTSLVFPLPLLFVLRAHIKWVEISQILE